VNLEQTADVGWSSASFMVASDGAYLDRRVKQSIQTGLDITRNIGNKHRHVFNTLLVSAIVSGGLRPGVKRSMELCRCFDGAADGFVLQPQSWGFGNSEQEEFTRRLLYLALQCFSSIYDV
jgi:hypothetical protein